MKNVSAAVATFAFCLVATAFCPSVAWADVNGQNTDILQNAPTFENSVTPPAPPLLPPLSSPDEDEDKVYVPTTPFGIPLSLTVRGGVSLGALEAGYLYYFAETLKKNPGIFDARIVTGASAGSINAIVLLMSLGGRPEPNPENSLFYRLWTSLNQKTLLDTDNQATPQGALSSGEALVEAGELVWNTWKEGLDDSFEMILAMSTTRLNPFEIEVANGLTLQRLSEKFVFIVKGRGFGRPPEILNYVAVKPGGFQPMLPFDNYKKSDDDKKILKKARKNFEMWRDAILASAAFPVGFPPKRIDYCLMKINENTDGTECTEASHSDLFIDGGVFDNNPLRVAHRIAAMGLSRNGDGKLIRLNDGHEPHLYNYVDPENTSYPSAPVVHKDNTGQDDIEQNGGHQGSRTDSEQDIDIFKMMPRFFGSFVSTARTAELYTLLESYPEMSKRLNLTTTDYPVISAELGAFFGFFDREFLKFDFFLGMYSAGNYVSRIVDKYLHEYNEREIVNTLKHIAFPEDGVIDKPEWAPLVCMRGWYDNNSSFQNRCASVKSDEARRENGAPDMNSFKILLQVSLDRLYNHCAILKKEATGHAHCDNAMLHKGSPPRIIQSASRSIKDFWRRCRVCKIQNKRCRRRYAQENGCVCKCGGSRSDESGFVYTMRLLETYGFHFRDLGVGVDRPVDGLFAIKDRFLEILLAFSEKHDADRRLIIEALGKPALNFIKYSPPKHILYVSAWNAMEFGWSRAFAKVRWMRFSFSPIQVKGLLEAFTAKALAFAPTFGLNFEILPLSTPLFQARFGVHVGYQFSTQGGFTQDSCKEDCDSSAPIRCSFPLIRGVVAFSFFERARIHLGVEWSAPWFEKLPPENSHWVTLIAGLGWQWLSPF